MNYFLSLFVSMVIEFYRISQMIVFTCRDLIAYYKQ